MKIIASIAITLAVVGGGFYFSLLSPAAAVSTPTVEDANKRLDAFRKISLLTINTEILNDKLFQALRPANASSSPLEKKRENPFLPF